MSTINLGKDGKRPNKNVSALNVDRFDDGRSDWGGAESQPDGKATVFLPHGVKRAGDLTGRSGGPIMVDKDLLKTTSRVGMNNRDQPKRLIKNNLMGSTQQSFAMDQNSDGDAQ